jgi:hypothetical protein
VSLADQFADVVREAEARDRSRTGRRDRSSRAASVSFRPSSEVRPEPVEWAWEGRVPTGAVTLLVGAPGLGKSTVSIDLAARLSRGEADGDLNGEPVIVAMATAEDAIAATVLPRLVAARADRSMVRLIQVEDEDGQRTLTLPTDTEPLAARVREEGVRLVIIDPLVAHLPAEVNSHRDQDVRRAIAPLARMAEESGAAVLAIVHLNKSDTTEVLARVSGSVGFVAASRSVLLLGRDPQDQHGPTRVLAHVKSNLAVAAPALRLRLDPRTIDEGRAIEAAAVTWLEVADGVHPAQLLSSGTERGQASEEAETFLRVELRDGLRPAEELRKEAERAGIRWATLRRAKEALKVRSERFGFGSEGRWYWTLPDPPIGARKDAQSPEGEHLWSPSGETPQVGPIDAQENGTEHLPGTYGGPEEGLALIRRRFQDGERNLFVLARELNAEGHRRPDGRSWTAAALAAVLGVAP